MVSLVLILAFFVGDAPNVLILLLLVVVPDRVEQLQIWTSGRRGHDTDRVGEDHMFNGNKIKEGTNARVLYLKRESEESRY